MNKSIPYIKQCLLGVLVFTFSVTDNVLMAAKGKPAEEAAQVSLQDEQRSPIGCRDVGYEFDLRILKLYPEAAGMQQSLYFMFNKSNDPIALYQMLSEESSRSVPLNHTINGRQWGILSVGEKEVKYICTQPTQESHYGKIIDCASRLKVCEFDNVKYGLNNRGNFWIANDSSRNGAVMDVVHYGIIPGN